MSWSPLPYSGCTVSGTDLSQAEADALLALPKCRADDREWDYPASGGSIMVPLVSEDRREQFLLDVSRGRGRVEISRTKLQNRARQVIVLVRLEIDGPAHRNPDDSEVPCPHLHLYREGFHDKWAFPVPPGRFRDLGDAWEALCDFMSYCNVVEPPAIRRVLFT